MTIAALVAGATFAGCTDDENDNKKYDEDGNEIVDEPGNTPGGDVELKEKRVAKIWYADADENGTLYYEWGMEFAYDDNRIKRITYYDCEEDGTVIDEYTTTSTVDYGPAKVTVYDKDGEKEQAFDLEDGHAIAGEDLIGTNHTTFNYEYTDGYLTKVTMAETNVDSGEGYTNSYSYQVEDGLWTGATFNEDGDKGTLAFEMSDVENNQNVDLYITCYPFSEYSGIDCLLGLIGDRMKYLPERMTIEYEGYGIAETWEFQYQQNDEGYVTEVMCRLGDAGDKVANVWLIEYE